MPKGVHVNGLRIAQARLALPGRPTQAEFAQRIGVHWVTQSNIENGKTRVSLELLEKIARETGCTRDELLAECESNGEDEDSELPTAAEQDFIEDLVAPLRLLGARIARIERQLAEVQA